jgi:hypothetical protein
VAGRIRAILIHRAVVGLVSVRAVESAISVLFRHDWVEGVRGCSYITISVSVAWGWFLT